VHDRGSHALGFEEVADEGRVAGRDAGTRQVGEFREGADRSGEPERRGAEVEGVDLDGC
jgi:hypothetical protein